MNVTNIVVNISEHKSWTIPLIIGLVIGVIGVLIALFRFLYDHWAIRRSQGTLMPLIKVNNFDPLRKTVKADLPRSIRQSYLPVVQDQAILDALHQKKDVLICGRPGLGKTRTAGEAIRKIKGWWVLEPVPQAVTKLESLRIPRKKNLVFLDDLNNYLGIRGSGSLDGLLEAIRRRSKLCLVVATCRNTKPEWEALSRDTQFMHKFEVFELTNWEEAQGERLAGLFGRTLNRQDWDNTPLSVVAPRHEQFVRFREQATPGAKNLLRALLLLRDSGLSPTCPHLLLEAYQLPIIGGIASEFDAAFEEVRSRGFLKPDRERISGYDPYLDDIRDKDWPVIKAKKLEIMGLLIDRKLAEELFCLADSFYVQEDYTEAAACLQVSISLNPSNAEAHNNLGILLVEGGDLEGAKKKFGEAILLNPDFNLAYINLGNAFFAQGKFPEAEKEFRKAIRLSPDFALAHINLGNALNSQAKLLEAEKEYREAIRLSPDEAHAYSILGGVLIDQGKFEEVERVSRIAIRLDPYDAKAHVHLGSALANQGKPEEEVEKVFREAIRLSPNLAEAHNGLGVVLGDQGKPDESEKELREAIRLNPDFGVAYGNLAILLESLGRRKEARENWEKALQLTKDQARIEFIKKRLAQPD